MNLPFYIARRYFFSRKKKNLINILSIISMVGVGVGTMALVIVLSAFNGLEDLVRDLYNTFDPELKISATTGKAFEVNERLLSLVRNTEGVAVVTEVVEDNALLRFQDAQRVVKIKGVGDSFLQQSRLDSAIVGGELQLKSGAKNLAILGIGIQQSLSIPLHSDFEPIQFWYPKQKRSMSLDPTASFNKMSIVPGGVFRIEQQFDDRYVFVPLDFAVELLNYGQKRTSLEVKAKPGYTTNQVKQKLTDALGDSFRVQDSDEQHESLMRALKIEKLFVFLALAFILVIASFNIYVSLSMLVIDKKRDVAILFAMGGTASLIKRIFMAEGAIIAFTGTVVGLTLGLVVCWLQIEYGLVSIGIESALVQAYPVKLQVVDFVVTFAAVVIITFLASFGPASRAARKFVPEHLTVK